MPVNPYTAQLEDQLARVKTRRWQTRRKLDLISRGHRFAGDEYDMRRLGEALSRELQYLEREYGRLHHELGIPMPLQRAIRL
jgi:hypothetical protein